MEQVPRTGYREGTGHASMRWKKGLCKRGWPVAHHAQGPTREVCTILRWRLCAGLGCWVVVGHASAQLFQPWDVPGRVPIRGAWPAAARSTRLAVLRGGPGSRGDGGPAPRAARPTRGPPRVPARGPHQNRVERRHEGTPSRDNHIRSGREGQLRAPPEQDRLPQADRGDHAPHGHRTFRLRQQRRERDPDGQPPQQGERQKVRHLTPPVVGSLSTSTH